VARNLLAREDRIRGAERQRSILVAVTQDQLDWPAQAAPLTLRRTPRYRGATRGKFTNMRALLSLRPFRLEMLILIGYIVVTRIFSLTAAKVGITIWTVPLFLTDLTLLALLTIALVTRPGRLLFWISSGRGATGAGTALWILCAASIVYFLFAFPIYKIMAARDLAIFCYCLFFPLTFFAVNNRAWAVRITRYCVYSGAALAVLMLLQRATGSELWLGQLWRNINGTWVAYVGGDDYGAITASSMMGLLAYAIVEKEYRAFHLVSIILCLLALAANGARSAVVSAALTGAVIFLVLSGRYRRIFLVFCAMLVGAIFAGATLPETVPGVRELHNFMLGLSSAIGGSSDMDTHFRIVRWHDAVATWLTGPVFGVGYGRDILHQALIGYSIEQKFNLGMPHNTYLFVLARMGLFGMGLIGLAMMLGIGRLFVAARRFRQPDDLAALSVLVSLAGYAAFVLFFERPMNNAGFWIMLAVGLRLAQTSRSAALAAARRPRIVHSAQITPAGGHRGDGAELAPAQLSA
jgi:O-antigen ligase